MQDNRDYKKFEELLRKYSENTVDEIVNCLNWTTHIKESIEYRIDNDNGTIDFIMNYYAPYLDYWLKEQPQPMHPRRYDPPGLGKPTFLNIPEDKLPELYDDIIETFGDIAFEAFANKIQG